MLTHCLYATLLLTWKWLNFPLLNYRFLVFALLFFFFCTDFCWSVLLDSSCSVTSSCDNCWLLDCWYSVASVSYWLQSVGTGLCSSWFCSFAGSCCIVGCYWLKSPHRLWCCTAHYCIPDHCIVFYCCFYGIVQLLYVCCLTHYCSVAWLAVSYCPVGCWVVIIGGSCCWLLVAISSLKCKNCLQYHLLESFIRKHHRIHQTSCHCLQCCHTLITR